MRYAACWVMLCILTLIGGVSLLLSLLAIADGRYDQGFFTVGAVLFMVWMFRDLFQEMRELRSFRR